MKATAGNAAAYNQMSSNMERTRRDHMNYIKSLDLAEVRTVKALSATEQYTKKLIDQKVHMGEAIKQRGLFNKVVQEQINLQRAMAVSWSKQADGKIVSDLIIPKDAVSRTQMFRTQLSVLNETIRSVSDNMVKWGKNTQWAGRQLTVGIGVPMAIAAAATGKMAYDMDKALTNITKVYGDANSQFQDSTEQIRKASWETAQNMTSMYGQSAKDTLEITSQFAAAGKTGVELQQATAAATKARMLNEIDLQTAIQASITMQTVYGYSAEELGQKWDYINAVANQTILGAEDFAVAIPKVSGVMKELGATLEDVGVYMTAMKASGIDAAEGANALKTISFRSVAAYGKGLETFKKNTGQDLKQIVAQTNGQVVPTLNKMWEAMAGLTVPEKIATVKDVFGIYQGNKALNLLEQLAAKSDQVAQAMAVGKNSIAENAAIANQELARMNAQPFKKIEKAVENIKNQMAELGQTVLPVVSWVLELVGSILEFANRLDDGSKKILAFAVGAGAVIGPLIMLVGLMGNLAGMFGKGATTIGGLITRLKLLTPEQRAAELLSKRAASTLDVQTSATAQLTQAIAALNEKLVQKNALLKQNLPASPKMGTVPEGLSFTQLYKKDGSPYNSLAVYKGEERIGQITRERLKTLEKEWAVLGQIEREELVRANTIEAQNKAIASRNRNIAYGISGTATTAGLLGSMMGSGKVQQFSELLLTFGLISSLMPGMLTKMVGFFTAGIRGSAKLNTALSSVKGRMTGLGSTLKSVASSVALPLTLAAAGIAAFWAKVESDASEAADKVKAIANSTDTWAQTLGYNKVTAGELASQGATDGTNATKAMAATVRETNAELANALSETSGKKIGEKWAIAINEGVKVKLTGGTEDAAKQATRVALELMGESFSDAEFDLKIKDLNVDFSNTKTTVTGINSLMNKAMTDKGSGWEKFWREDFVGQDDVSSAGKEAAEAAATQFWQSYQTMASDKRNEFVNDFVAEQTQGLQEAYKQVADQMSYGDFLKMLNDAAPDNKLKEIFGFEKFNTLGRQADAINVWATSVTNAAGIADKIGENPSVDSLQRYLNGTNDLLMASEKSGKASQTGMDAAAQGMADAQFAADNLVQTLKELGVTQDADKVTSVYKDVMNGVQGSMFDFADRAWQDHADSVMNSLDSAADQASKNFDKQNDALEAKQDAAQERLKKKQDAREKSIEDSYDKRIKLIDKAIEREQAQEDQRQKNFEAEQRRMQRYATMFSKNVDFNAALSTGKLDEAAKIANDMQSQTVTWNSEDAAAASKEASDKRVDALNKQKDALDEEKKSRMDALKAVEDAENKALENRQKREKAALKATQDADKARRDSAKRTAQAKIDRDKRALDIELATIRAFVPRNNAEMEKQKAQIDAAYRKYGVSLTSYGKNWSNIIGTSMKNETAKAANQIKSEIAWASIGAEISNQLLKGGFGMTAKQFATWLNGGNAPAGSLFNPISTKGGPQHGSAANTVKQRNKHGGGVVGKSDGKGRVGYAGKQQAQSEVWINALKGEGVVNRKAMDFIGEEGLSALNSGKLPANTGPWGPAVGAAGMAAAVSAAATKRVMSETLNAVANNMSSSYSLDSSGVAKYAGINLSPEQLRNAATIMSVGKSMGASARDLQIALMTAMQESTLRNLSYGDRDSVGLFQQRPSQGWGTVEQIMDPKYASRKFFSNLFNVKDRNKMPMTLAAQAVQRSAFPMAYARWEDMARAIVTGATMKNGGFGSKINMSKFMGLGTAGGWVKPANGPISSEYGMRVNPVTGIYKLHGGIDIAAGAGSAIHAAKRGLVTMSGFYPSVGNYVRLDHGNGIQTGYAHQSKILARAGQTINAGQTLGYVGSTGNSTGPHLHFEYWKGGARRNPREIIPKFAEGGYTLSSGLGMLHPKETVLSKPLSQDLHTGLDRFANGDPEGYNITIDMRGAMVKDNVDIKQAVYEAIDERERRRGRSRRMGDNK